LSRIYNKATGKHQKKAGQTMSWGDILKNVTKTGIASAKRRKKQLEKELKKAQ
jgi:hypothetical protein